MNQHRVFVIWSNPIFRDSLHMVLRHPDVDIVGSEKHFEQAVEGINNLKPDTILIEITEKHPLVDFIKFLEQETPHLQIIGISMEDNRATLFHRENRSVIHEDELLEIILKQP